jgi:hypothetical protein
MICDHATTATKECLNSTADMTVAMVTTMIAMTVPHSINHGEMMTTIVTNAPDITMTMTITTSIVHQEAINHLMMMILAMVALATLMTTTIATIAIAM